MENRFFKLQRNKLYLLLFLLLGIVNYSSAQQLQFIVTYNGSNTINVGSDCTAPLRWFVGNSPVTNPTFTPVNPSAQLLATYLGAKDQFGNNLSIDQPIAAGTVVTITYNIIDLISAQQASYVFVLTFVDATAPVFNPTQLAAIPVTVTVDCLSELPGVPTLTATDNCTNPTPVTLSEVNDLDLCQGGQVVRTWVATDASNNSTSFVQTITVNEDDSFPVINGILVNGNSTCATASQDYQDWLDAQRAALSATDEGCGLVVDAGTGRTVSDDADEASEIINFCGDFVVTFSATDLCGHVTTQQATFSVADAGVPTISTPAQDLVFTCNGGNPMDAFQDWINNNGNAAATDDCGGVFWTTDPPAPAFPTGCTGVEGSVNVTFIASDRCGGSVTTNATFSIQDDTPPRLRRPSVSAVVACDGGPMTTFEAWLNANQSLVIDGCTPSSAITFTYETPYIDGDRQTIVDLFNSDQVDIGCQTISLGATTYSNVVKLLSVTFVASDACGNEFKFTETYGWNDLVEPVIVTPAQDFEIECASAAEITTALENWVNTLAGMQATDNCGTISYGYDRDLATIQQDLAVSQASSCGNTGSVVVSFFAEDGCGQRSELSTATFSVLDKIAPTFAPSPSLGVYSCIDLSNQSAIQADFDNWLATRGGGIPVDDCGAANWLPSYMWGDSQNIEGNESDPIVVPTFTNICDTWAIIVSFQAEDECGNQSTVRGVYTVGDVEAPAFTSFPPGDSIFTCGHQIYDFELEYNDNCGGVGSVNSVTTINQNTDCEYTFTRTWTAIDACGNFTNYQQTNTIIDDQAPVFATMPDNITVECDEIPNIDLISVTDNCSSILEIEIRVIENIEQGTDPNNCNYYNYSLTRTWIATDECDNSASVSQRIVVIDETAPTFVVPEAVSISCDQLNNLTVTGSPTSVNDNCDAMPEVTYVDDVDNPICGNTYAINRIWTVTDACGNSSTGVQVVTLGNDAAPFITSPAVSVTFDCFEQNIETLFEEWVTNNASAEASDNCDANALNWFAAVPGSYDINDPNTFPGTSPGNLDPSTCDNATVGILRAETVDFVVFDPCKKAAVTTATFSVTDIVPPTIEYCHGDTIVNGDGGACNARFTLFPPVVSEDCGLSTTPVAVTQTMSITSNAPGNTEVPVNAASFQLTLPPPPFYAIDGSINVQLVIENGDMEEPTEFFNIIGENGELLGQTNPSSNQCNSVSITNINISAEQLNFWAVDGTLGITLTPNIPDNLPGIYAVNDICTSTTQATINLEYDVEFTGGLNWAYSINGATAVVVDPIQPTEVTLENGVNQIVYTVTDCAKNTSTCSFTVTVKDVEAPVIVCPNDIVNVLANDGTCSQLITLPLPVSITDNCGFPSVFTQTQPNNPLINFTYNPNILQYLANDKTINFTGVQSNAIEDVVLKIRIQGDIASAGEYFSIIGENNVSLGTTEVGQTNVSAGDCSTESITTIVIPSVQFNQWAADGILTIRAVSNINLPLPPNNTGVGINPCDPTSVNSNGDNDGISTLYMDLSYGEAMPYYYTIGATTIATTPITTNPEINFSAGTTTVFYEVLDNEGNLGSCSFDVSVLDQIAPNAVCQSTTIYVNPSGNDNYTMVGDEINAGSTDNCEITSYMISPSSFTCNQAGSIFIATMVVSDAAGNTDVCAATIRIETAIPVPSFTTDACGGSNLNLFTNPPQATGNVYTYQWSGPNGFVSNIQNPVIPNANNINSGSYSVTVTGVTGCTAVGVVEVSIVSQPATPSITLQGNIGCENQPLVLNTQPYSGNGITYEWYQGVYPNGTFLQNTNIPQFTIANPVIGTYQFYLIVNRNGCESNPSSTLTVTVRGTPTSTFTNNTQLVVCEGSQVSLGAAEAGLGYSYQWTGPNGFVSSSQFPAVFNAQSTSGGNYNLIVTVNGCSSPIGTTNLVVNPRPAQPQLAQSTPACSGGSVTLIASTTGGDIYQWTAPNFNSQLTTGNTLTLNNLDASLNGSWTVKVTKNGCESLVSNPLNLIVNPTPNAASGSNSPVCNNAALQLSVVANQGANYIWNGPNNFISFQQNATVNTPIAGMYNVTVTSAAGCSATSAVNVVVNEAVVVTAISNTGDDCSNGEDVFLIPTVFPIDNGTYSYIWTGPNGYAANGSMPQLPTGTSGDNGQYTLLVLSANGCFSTPVSTIVNINDAPVAPVLNANSTNFCQGETINLITTNYGAGYTYNWITPIGNFTTLTPSLTIPNVTSIHTGNYSVSAEVNGCESNFSLAIFVQVFSIPSQPIVISNSPVCVGGNIELNTDLIPGAVYEWTGPGGFTSNVYNPVILDAQLINEGAYQVMITLANCESGLSQPGIIDIINTPTQPIAINSGTVCINGQSQTLNLTVTNNSATPGATYTWYNGANGNVIGSTTSLTLALTDFTGFQAGVNTFYVVADFQGCVSAPSIQTSNTFELAPGNTAFAGLDDFACAANQVVLNANQPSGSEGTWTSLQAGTQIIEPNSAITTALSLQEGVNQFVWSLSTDVCGVYSTDTVAINFETGGTAFLDTFFIAAGQNTNINVINNDDLPSGLYTITITDSPDNGFIQTTSVLGEFTYRPETDFNGVDQFTYEICNVNCPDECTSAIVLIGVGTRVDCIAPTIITPNNDGVNDSFIISCLNDGKYPNNEVAVFNQWGDEVFRSTNYNNLWFGTYQGEPLPVGTYYYVVNLGDNSKPMAGFLLIER